MGTAHQWVQHISGYSNHNVVSNGQNKRLREVDIANKLLMTNTVLTVNVNYAGSNNPHIGQN
jgi:hypothetical protein